MDYNATKDLSQVEFAHRAMTTPSGNLKRHVTIEAYLHAMKMARLGVCREDVLVDEFINGPAAWDERQRVLTIPNSVEEGERWNQSKVDERR